MAGRKDAAPVSTRLPYAVVVATYERPSALARLLESLAAQTFRPASVWVIDSSRTPTTVAADQALTEQWKHEFACHWCAATSRGAAPQRNQGLARVAEPLVAFIDDDAVPTPSTLESLAAVLAANSAIGGAGARMEPEGSHPRPRGLLWWYYRLQAGYPHRDYGGKLFGPGLVCFPCFEPGREEPVEVEWLPAGCAIFRTELARREGFPEFPDYSFMEDAHFSARIARTHRLVAVPSATFWHEDAPSPFKADATEWMRVKFRNQAVVAREILGVQGWSLAWRLALHRIFVSVWLLRQRRPGWPRALQGVWS
jgi:GT2 family glycosyltransferase